VIGDGTPTLTIEPGVELRFNDYLLVGEYNPSQPDRRRPAKLIAVGTPEEPIVFTSSKRTRAAGDWPGIYLLNAAGSSLQHVRIEYAGGRSSVVSANCRPNNTSDDAGLLLSTVGSYIPSASDFSDVLISDSANHGINAMWSNTSFGPDLTAGFSFMNVVHCKQTKNNRPSGCGAESGCLR
jgi:hypothetical protein